MNFKTLLFLLLFANSILAQEYGFYIGKDQLTLNDNNLYEDKYGKCYEESILLSPYDDVQKFQNRYPNKETETVEVREGNLVMEIVEAKVGWKKVKAKNCKSTKQSDCMLWCLVEIPKRIVSAMRIDSSMFVDLNSINKANQTMLMEGGFLIFSEIECALNPDDYIFAVKTLSDYFNKEIKDDDVSIMIKRYQFENELPIGNMNLETLYHMEAN